MRLSYLSCMHGTFFVGAVLAAVFIGMVLAFKVQHAYEQGKVMGEASVLIKIDVKHLTALEI